MEGPVQFPPELRAVKPLVDGYVHGRLRQFGTIVCRRLNHSFTKEQVDLVLNDAFNVMAQQDAVAQPPRNLRLVIRHDCQSTGCGDTSCVLCQYNPSRLCTRNVKQKYLIDDHLKAKCTAPLRVELVDDAGACYTDGLPPGVQLEMHVLNGEKYKELCPDNTLLSTGQIKTCIINHHTKALLKREGMSDDQLRVFLPLERGQATMSDLSLTTSSEALLSGKAPTFRLLVWAVDGTGEPVSYVTYVVSESFVVATKRVKHAIKSDIPSVADHISKLLHIGKATVDKMMDLPGAFAEEGFDVRVPEDLIRVERVGQFKQLVELSENNSDLKGKLRHVLKLSPEKWEEVCQHALSAVVPDFRNRVWWAMQLGLLYACKNGAVMMDQPIGVVKLGATPDTPHTVVPVQNLSPQDFNALPTLKQQALQSWYMPNHPNWAIYGEGGPDMPLSGQQQHALNGQATPATAMGMGMALPPVAAGPPPYLGSNVAPAAGAMRAPSPQSGPDMYSDMYNDMYGGGSAAAMQQGGAQRNSSNAMASMAPGPVPTGPRNSNSSPFAMLQQPGMPTQGSKGGMPGSSPMPDGSGPTSSGMGGSGLHQGSAAMAMQQAPMQQGMPNTGSGGVGSAPGRSPFMAGTLMQNIQEAFPNFLQPPPPPGGNAGGGVAMGAGVVPSIGPGGESQGAGNMFPSLEMLKTEELMDRGYSLFQLQSMQGDPAMRSTDWLATLPGAASYTMMDVPPGGAPVDGLGLGPPGAQGGLGQLGDGVGLDARRLSMKLNSMSLDLDKVIAEHAGS